jgi:type IV fimbrial biogenesis protein FimT
MMKARHIEPAIRRRDRPVCRRDRGFSVVELIVVMSIAVTLMTVAAPSMGMFVRNSRLQAQALELMRMMHLARSEAVKRKSRVVLCRSVNPTAAVPACGGVSNTWTTGYVVFASGDGNSTYEAGTDELLRIGMPARNGLTVVTNSTSNNNLEFNFDGTTNESGGTARFAICDPRGGSFGRQIDVTPVGRPALSQGTSAQPVKCMSPT